MFSRIRTAALAGIVGMGALAAAPATAQADSFYFGISPAGPSWGFHAGPRHDGPRYDNPRRPGWDRNHGWDRGRGWNRPARFDCTAGQALRKADRIGINRAFIRGQNHRLIHVGGRSRGQFVTVTFAKAPNCPIVG